MKIIWIILLSFLLSCNNNYKSDTIYISRDAMKGWLDSTKSRIEFYRALRKEQNDSTQKLWALVDSINSRPDRAKNRLYYRAIKDSIIDLIDPISKRKSDEYDIIRFYIGRQRTFEILLGIDEE